MELALPKVHYGLAGYSCLLVVFIGSLYPVRRYAYEMFLFTHLFAFGFIGVIAKHTPYAMRYFATGLIVYFLNACAGWFVKSHLARSYTKVISPQCVRLSLRLASPMLHKSGDAVSLCIPSLSIFQWHPFTITSTNPEGTATDKLEVYVTVCGHWTRKLVQKADTSQELTVFVSGPFGDASSHLQAKTMLSTHDSIVIISGGAGITFGIRLLRELTAMFMDTPETQWKPMIKTNTIHFVWSVRSTDDLWFRTEIERILSFYENAHHKDPDYFPSLQVSLHVTRSSSALESSGNIDETFFTKQEKGFQQDVSEAYELEEQDTVGSCCRATDSITIKYSRFDLRLLSEMHSDQLGVYGKLR
ncbi:hypothetical protein BDF14DRAFT_1721766 [Spinellus fusiger]|nr:hypothetical protein BDF14DRAFT_1721766 [Spinellus fusiger]